MPSTYSVLRYPGGKSQLEKYVSYLLKVNHIKDTYIEPFAGGFGVGLYLLLNDKINKIVMNDFDPSIFSVWYAILNRKEDLIDLIKNTDIDIDEWYHQKKLREYYFNDPYSLENAFATLFLNRTNISGIISGGPIGGKEQKGKYKINCRFNKNKIIEKVEKINEYKDRITLYNKDASDFIQQNLIYYDNLSTFIFFDPPYYKQGKNLYLSFVEQKDHAELANKILSLDKYKWILTYDKEQEILRLYKPKVKSFEYELNYSANNKRKAKEYMFSSDATQISSYDNVILHRI